MKLAVIGSRDFNDYLLLASTIEERYNDPHGIFLVSQIVSGACPTGADRLAAHYAMRNMLELVEYLADWDKHGKKAGYLRNKLIINHCDEVLAFWDGVSPGTKSSIELARLQKKNTTIIYF